MMKNMSNDDLILRLSVLYDFTTKKAHNEAIRIVKELYKRGIIKDIEHFMTIWER